VGAIDKSYLQTLIEKVERTIQKKIRVAVYAPAEFSDDILNSITNWVDLL
jgi:tRNA A37 methylthiotransferase MiaB